MIGVGLTVGLRFSGRRGRNLGLNPIYPKHYGDMGIWRYGDKKKVEINKTGISDAL